MNVLVLVKLSQESVKRLAGEDGQQCSLDQMSSEDNTQHHL